MTNPERNNHSELPQATSLEIIKRLKRMGTITETSPLWWDTDYAPDPRECLPFGDFQRRLVFLGKRPEHSSLDWSPAGETDVYLYPHQAVPMSVLELEVGGQPLSFLVTVRPYNEKERPWDSPPFEELRARAGVPTRLADHYYPHIRGLFAGEKSNHYFWYPLRISNLDYQMNWATEIENGRLDVLKEQARFRKGLFDSLGEAGLSFLCVYEPSFSERRSYRKVWRELSEKPGLVDQKKPAWPNFRFTEVSRDEFVEAWPETSDDLLVYYPVRVPGIEVTLPVIVATRTHQEDVRAKPAVLGIYAENGLTGFCQQRGILRVKNRQLAEELSKKTTQDFGPPVDAVLFTPKKGRPKYERVTAY